MVEHFLIQAQFDEHVKFPDSVLVLDTAFTSSEDGLALFFALCPSSLGAYFKEFLDHCPGVESYSELGYIDREFYFHPSLNMGIVHSDV